MKYAVRRFKSLKLALREIEPFVRNGAHLQTGKAFKQLGDMRSREILADLSPFFHPAMSRVPG